MQLININTEQRKDFNKKTVETLERISNTLKSFIFHGMELDTEKFLQFFHLLQGLGFEIYQSPKLLNYQFKMYYKNNFYILDTLTNQIKGDN